MIEYYSNCEEETNLIAKKVADKIKPGNIIFMNGELGVGKTTLTKYIVRQLGSKDLVSSPTFSIVNHYQAPLKIATTPLPQSDLKLLLNIFHFDAYRISSQSDLESIGFFDYINEENILIIEWAENIKNLINITASMEIIIRYIDENSRRISIISN